MWADLPDHLIVGFELQGERYIVSGAYDMDLPIGASIESVDPARWGFREVEWRHARQCTYIDSNRIRNVYFDAGRVTVLSGVYYD